MHATNFEELQQLIETDYIAIWGDWFDDSHSKAELTILESDNDATAKYYREKDIIEIPLPNGSLTDYYAKRAMIEIGLADANDENWKLWKESLVHEMLHEYEAKSIDGATKDGDKLKAEMEAQQRAYLPDSKHPPEFYAAVHEKAAYFDMDPLMFALRIR